MSPRSRSRAHLALVVLVAGVAALALASLEHPVRTLAAFLAAALVPGAAVLSRAPVDDVLAWLGLSVALSLAIETACSLAMVWLGLWSPLGLAAILGTGSVVALLGSIRHRDPEPA